MLQASAGAAVHIERLDDAERSRVRRGAVGFVFQHGLLVPELTAAGDVAAALMLAPHGRGRSGRARLAGYPA